MMNEGRRGWFRMGSRVAGLCFLLALPAQATDSALISSSREIAKQGVMAYDAGDYERAEQLFAKAYEAVQVPTLALYRARALEKLGRLVEAGEFYRLATKLSTGVGEQEVQVQAQQEAAQEREALMPRIPRLFVDIKAPDPSKVVVQVDQRAVPPAILSGGFLVDPGAHEVVGALGKKTVTERVTLAEGARTRIVLRLHGEEGAAPGGPRARRAGVDEKSTQSQPLQTAGWVALGVGGGALVFGTVAALQTKRHKEDLDDAGCVGKQCDDALRSDVDTYNRWLTLTNVSFIAGGVLAATGIGLVVAAPHLGQREKSATRSPVRIQAVATGLHSGSSSEEVTPQGVSVSAYLGLGQVGVTGRF